MRRKKQLLDSKECIDILNSENCGVLALLGDNDYPYSVPISYVYINNKIYFHGAKSGHKIDAIKKHSKASFCVIHKNDIVAEEYTTYFRSVIAFGTIKIIEDDAERMVALKSLAVKFHPQGTDNDHMAEINKFWNSVCMIEFNIEHLTGKEAIELVRQKNK